MQGGAQVAILSRWSIRMSRSTRQRQWNFVGTSHVEVLEPRRLLAVVGIPIGYGAKATGGAGGATVTVSNAADFIKYATQSAATTIQVQGTIDVGGTRVASNKSILGLGANATLKGDLGLYG